MNYQQHRKTVLARYNNCCAWCGSTWDLCLDHIDTQACGGSDSADNLQILCRRCNSIKGPYCMPALKPRLPQLDDDKCYRRQNWLKFKVMPARRRGYWDVHIPKAVPA